jgi:hypothetical protein
LARGMGAMFRGARCSLLSIARFRISAGRNRSFRAVELDD